MEWNCQNPCFGCGNCCSDVRIGLRAGNLQTLSGGLYKHVTNPEKAIDLNEVPRVEGVYYAYGKRDFYLRIVGQCPELGGDGKCKIYKSRPKGCRQTQIGDGLCQDRTNGRGYSNDYIPIHEVLNP